MEVFRCPPSRACRKLPRKPVFPTNKANPVAESLHPKVIKRSAALQPGPVPGSAAAMAAPRAVKQSLRGGRWRLGEQVRCSEGFCEISTAAVFIARVQHCNDSRYSEAFLWFLLLAREPSQARCPTLGREAEATAQEQRSEQKECHATCHQPPPSPRSAGFSGGSILFQGSRLWPVHAKNGVRDFGWVQLVRSRSPTRARRSSSRRG